MNTFRQAAMALAIGIAATASAQDRIVIEATRIVIDPSALIGEDSGSAYFASLPLGPGLDRIVVVAELDDARTSGELGAWVGEDSGSFHLSRSFASVSTASADGGRSLVAFTPKDGAL